VRVAAVVADGPPPESGVLSGLWPAESLAYRDVEATIARYQPQVALAAQRGARILVLPEVSVYLEAAARPRWLAAVQDWARAHQVAIVAPYFNAALPRNELVIVDTRGVVGEYEKQHPARGLEPPRRQRLPVGPHVVAADGGEVPLSTAICVDLDYADTARSARHAGGLLTVPANDWPGFAAMHHRAAVWAAVLARVPVVRATGHGISAIFDRAGRVIAQQSSEHGPVVLVADVEL
jgi:apolipoprotein N-acyltransferase